MNFVIVFMLPSILGLKLFMSFNKDKKTFDYIIDYFLFLLFSNFGIMLVINILNNNISNIVEYISNNFDFAIKYITISLMINIFLAFIYTITRKYITFDIEVENGRKKQTKKAYKNY